MAGLLDEQYFEFLISETGWTSYKGTYEYMLETLYEIPFEPIIKDDENRALDGLWFRKAYCAENRIEDEWANLPCSFYELIIGLGYRISFIVDVEFKEIFWQLISNAGLADMTDQAAFGEEIRKSTALILERINDRNINFYGEGGFFPLRLEWGEDQRDVSLWKQMSYYILENYDV